MRSNYLIKAAKRMVVTPDNVRMMEQRLLEHEKRIEQAQRSSRITNEFLNRVYSI